MPTSNADAIYCSMLLALLLTRPLSIIFFKCSSLIEPMPSNQCHRHPPSKVPIPNPYIQFKPAQGNQNQSHPKPPYPKRHPSPNPFIKCHSKNNQNTTPQISPKPSLPTYHHLITNLTQPNPAPNAPAPPRPSSPKPHTTAHAPPGPQPQPSQFPPQSFQSAPRTQASPASRAPRSQSW